MSEYSDALHERIDGLRDELSNETRYHETTKLRLHEIEGQLAASRDAHAATRRQLDEARGREMNKRHALALDAAKRERDEFSSALDSAYSAIKLSNEELAATWRQLAEAREECNNEKHARVKYFGILLRLCREVERWRNPVVLTPVCTVDMVTGEIRKLLESMRQQLTATHTALAEARFIVERYNPNYGISQLDADKFVCLSCGAESSNRKSITHDAQCVIARRDAFLATVPSDPAPSVPNASLALRDIAAVLADGGPDVVERIRHIIIEATGEGYCPVDSSRWASACAHCRETSGGTASEAAPGSEAVQYNCQPRIRIDNDEDGLDDLAVHDVELVRVERMAGSTIWGRLYLKGGGEIELCFWAKKAKVFARAENTAALDALRQPEPGQGEGGEE
jgi:hypothetical protein